MYIRTMQEGVILKRVVLIVIITLLLTSAMSVSRPQKVHFYIFGLSGCPKCVKLKSYLDKEYGKVVTFYDITTKSKYQKAYLKICELLFVGLQYKPIPLTGVVVNGKLKLIIVGYCELERLKALLTKLPSSGILVADSEERTIVNEELIVKLSQLFISLKTTLKGEEEAIVDVLPVVVSCALIDSVNPCTFLVFTALLLIVFHLAGKGRMKAVGIAFILAIYLTYLLMGLNLIRVIEAYSIAKHVVTVLGLVLGFCTIINTIRREEGGLLPEFIRFRIARIIERAVTVPLAFLAGVIVSISLLPCSAGPYLIALAYVSKLEFMRMLLLLLTYNAIFVVPLVLILVIVSTAEKRVRVIKKRRKRLAKMLSLMEGMLLISLATYLLIFE